MYKKHSAVVKYEKADLAQVNPQLFEWLRSINAKSASKGKISQPDTGVKQNSSRAMTVYDRTAILSKDSVDTYLAAYENGEKPISKWTKSDIFTAVERLHPDAAELIKNVNVDMLRHYLLYNSSWHHTPNGKMTKQPQMQAERYTTLPPLLPLRLHALVVTEMQLFPKTKYHKTVPISSKNPIAA